MCTRSAQCAMTRTTCFMALFRTVSHGYRFEVGCRRERGAGRGIANRNRSGFLCIRAALLVRLDGDAIRPKGYGSVFVVEALPHQFIFPGLPRGACDRCKPISVVLDEIPDRREIGVVL